MKQWRRGFYSLFSSNGRLWWSRFIISLMVRVFKCSALITFKYFTTIETRWRRRRRNECRSVAHRLGWLTVSLQKCAQELKPFVTRKMIRDLESCVQLCNLHINRHTCAVKHFGVVQIVKEKKRKCKSPWRFNWKRRIICKFFLFN